MQPSLAHGSELSPAGHYDNSPSTSVPHVQRAMSLGLHLIHQGVPVREARVSCPRPLCPCVSQEALRVLTPLRRCQNLVCGDSLLGLLASSPWPEVEEKSGRRKGPKIPREPDEDSRQHPAALHGGEFSKSQGRPSVMVLLSRLPPLSPAYLSVR